MRYGRAPLGLAMAAPAGHEGPTAPGPHILDALESIATAAQRPGRDPRATLIAIRDLADQALSEGTTP